MLVDTSEKGRIQYARGSVEVCQLREYALVLLCENGIAADWDNGFVMEWVEEEIDTWAVVEK